MDIGYQYDIILVLGTPTGSRQGNALTAQTYIQITYIHQGVLVNHNVWGPKLLFLPRGIVIGDPA